MMNVIKNFVKLKSKLVKLQDVSVKAVSELGLIETSNTSKFYSRAMNLTNIVFT